MLSDRDALLERPAGILVRVDYARTRPPGDESASARIEDLVHVDVDLDD